jgi:formyl-CoA transferase
MPALDGIRILDMTQYEAGTSCTQALAWLGADVVKIEAPKTGDPGRGLHMGLWEDSEYFINWNSNKRSVAIDLRRQEGRDLLMKMVPHYDVFIENYGPGVIEKLNIGYEVMKEIHPGIIYGRLKGYGTSGPYSKYKSFDTVAQAAAGAMSITGDEEGPPMRIGLTIGDSGAGMQMATAILAAYIQRERTGKGQEIEISMQEALTYYMRTSIALGSKWGSQPAPRRGNGSSPIINLFPCKPFGHNDYVYIMSVAPRMWTDTCKAIGRPELETDPRFADHTARVEHKDELIEEISKWTREHTKHEAMKILCEGGVPAAATLDTKDLYTDPHLIERGFIQKINHEEQGEVPLLGWPARMSETNVEMEAAPLLGTSTVEVLKEDLGLDDDAVQALLDQEVIDDGRKEAKSE